MNRYLFDNDEAMCAAAARAFLASGARAISKWEAEGPSDDQVCWELLSCQAIIDVSQLCLGTRTPTSPYLCERKQESARAYLHDW